MEQYRKEHGATWIAVDAGNLLFENRSLGPRKAEQEKITAAGIVEAYKQMGYDAAGIGSYDLAAGLPYLLELRKATDFTWLSANLVRNADAGTVFPPYLVRSRGGTTFGIIGLTGNGVRSQLTEKDEVQLLPWSEVLPRLVPDLAGRCDFIILLSSLNTQENIAIARQFAGINLIIEAAGPNSNKSPVNAGNTLLAHTNYQGKYLGILQVDWQPSKIWQQTNLQSSLARKRAQLDRYNWQLKKIEAKGNPADLYKDTPELFRSYQRLTASRDQVAKEVAALTAKSASLPDGAVFATFTCSFLAMEKTLPDDLKVLALVEKIKSDIAEAAEKKVKQGDGHAAAARPINDDPYRSGYVGWKRCAGCHEKIVEKWRLTRHARAYESLVEKGQQFDQDCLPCHVTGVISGEEPYILTLPEELLQVGCEACHGPGRVHAESSGRHPLQNPDETVCLRCHTPDQDDHFVYNEKSRLVH